jgi:hypothetical protein
MYHRRDRLAATAHRTGVAYVVLAANGRRFRGYGAFSNSLG